MADDLGLPRQVCKGHAQRAEELQSLAKEDWDGSLKAIGMTSEQATADLDRLRELVRRRQPEQGEELEKKPLSRHLLRIIPLYDPLPRAQPRCCPHTAAASADGEEPPLRSLKRRPRRAAGTGRPGSAPPGP